jgi:demethoxyubiquinone hydroxylase (CLK1/Coq7/Cat5 family)
MSSQSSGGSFLAWAGLALAALAGLLGHLHLRVNRLEDRVASNHTDMQTEMGSGDDKLAARMDEMRRDDAAFRERLLREMASKDDVRELRASIERIVPGMPVRLPGAGR